MRESKKFLGDLWRLARPYWTSEDRMAGIGLICIIVGMSLGLVYLNVLLNQWNNAFYDTLQNRDWQGFTPTWPGSLPACTWRAAGCAQCRDTGYSGRIGIFEVMLISDKIKTLIGPDTELNAIRRQAHAQGMLSLRLAAAHKVANGTTSMEEALRVTPA